MHTHTHTTLHRLTGVKGNVAWLKYSQKRNGHDAADDIVTLWCRSPESRVIWRCRCHSPPPPPTPHTTDSDTVIGVKGNVLMVWFSGWHCYHVVSKSWEYNIMMVQAPHPPPPPHTHTYSTNLCSWCNAVDDTVTVWCENPESRKISWQCRRCTPPPHTHTLQTDAHGVMQWRTLLPCGVGVLRVERYHDRAGAAPPPPHQHTPQTDGYGAMQWRTLLPCGVGVLSLRIERYHDGVGTAPPPPTHTHTHTLYRLMLMAWCSGGQLPCGVGVLRVERYHDGAGTAAPPPPPHQHTPQTDGYGVMQWRTLLPCGVGVLRVERYHDRAGTAPPPPTNTLYRLMVMVRCSGGHCYHVVLESWVWE